MIWLLAYAAVGVVMATAQQAVWYVTERRWHWGLYGWLVLIWVGGLVGLWAFNWYILIPSAGAS